jgi:hypothetical protein
MECERREDFFFRSMHFRVFEGKYWGRRFLFQRARSNDLSRVKGGEKKKTFVNHNEGENGEEVLWGRN